MTDPLEDKVIPLNAPAVLADHSGTPRTLRVLREELTKAEAEARQSALREHGDFAKGLRAGFALALKMMDDSIYWSPDCFWSKVRWESREFEELAARERAGR